MNTSTPLTRSRQSAFVQQRSDRQDEPSLGNIYDDDVVRNIARFYQDVVEERAVNDTVRRSVDGALACILGREAAERGQRLTMEQVLKENRRLDLDLAGLKT